MTIQTKIFQLYYWDDPVLSTVCDRVENNEFGCELEKFGQELVATMRAKNGIGLAAPQCGILKRIFVMEIESTPVVVCNPVLSLGTEVVRDVEGCLSMPEVFLQIERAASVTMQYSDPLGKSFEIPLVSMNARVAQHEIDHLNGVFFLSKVSRQMRRAALKEWEKIRGRYT